MLDKRFAQSLILPAFFLLIAVVAIAAVQRMEKVAVMRETGSGKTECYSGQIGATTTIPGGRFQMGSHAFYPEEAPLTDSTVNDFNMDVHEVTNEQFRRFVDETGYVTSAERATELGFDANGSAVFANAHWAFVQGADWRHPDGPNSSIEGRDHEPVVQVSLKDAQAYAASAGRRLLTEAEYEYAARGRLIGAEYAWGKELHPNGESRANTWQGVFPFADTGDDGFSGRAAVGCFPSNPFGAYDLIGNVWEWTSDAYFPSYSERTDAGSESHPYGLDPRQPGLAVGVIKGGSFLCAENFCRRYRPAARHAQDILLGTNHIGFRTAADAESARP